MRWSLSSTESIHGSDPNKIPFNAKENSNEYLTSHSVRINTTQQQFTCVLVCVCALEIESISYSGVWFKMTESDYNRSS